jgi:hypothetical protein
MDVLEMLIKMNKNHFACPGNVITYKHQVIGIKTLGV